MAAKKDQALPVLHFNILLLHLAIVMVDDEESENEGDLTTASGFPLKPLPFFPYLFFKISSTWLSVSMVPP